MKQILKQILSDALRIRKTLTRIETWKIGESHGYIQSSIDRAFRSEKGNIIPCIKLNSRMKPAKHDEFIYLYKWAGGKTKFYEEKKEKKQSSGVTRKVTSKKESSYQRKSKINDNASMEQRKKT